MCEFCNLWVYVYVGFEMCGCFDNCVLVLVMCTCIYCVFVLFRLCVFILIFTSVRITATEGKLNCSKQ